MSSYYRLLNEVEMFIFVVIVFLQIYHVVSLVDHNNQIEAKIPGDRAVNGISQNFNKIRIFQVLSSKLRKNCTNWLTALVPGEDTVRGGLQLLLGLHNCPAGSLRRTRPEAIVQLVPWLCVRLPPTELQNIMKIKNTHRMCL